MSDIIANADKTVSGWFDNQYVTAAVALLLIVYSAYGVNRLSPYILRMFDMPLFKLLLFLLIVYLARKTPTIAIIAAIAFMVTLQALTKMKVDEAVLDSARGQMQKEGMENMEDVPTPKQEMVVHEIVQQEVRMPEESTSEILKESKGGAAPEDMGQCVVPLQYRNSFYPQYTNMKSDVYDARFAGRDVAGYDQSLGNPEINGYEPNANYAAL